jgi:putative DNA primase/helicase
MMQRPDDVIAFLIDRGNAKFIDEDATIEEPYATIIEALVEVDALQRGELFESLADGLGGEGDRIRTEVYAALQQRFAHKQDVAGLVSVSPALVDEKEQLDTQDLYRAVRTEEDGDADTFVSLYEGQVAYDHAEGEWFLWGGQYWERDRTNAVINLLKREVAAQYARAGADAIANSNDDAAKKFLKRAGRLHTRRRKEHVLWAAASAPGVAISGDEWDANPWLLGCPNGVVDLHDGSFRAGIPGDWIRTVVPTAWAGIDTPAPRWEQFISEIFDGDQELVGFVHRLLGYGITGLNSEHAFPVLYGPQGRNGKTTLLESLAGTLGPDVTMSIPADEVMHTYRGGDRPQPYIYKLRGKRVVWASETNPDRRLDQETVKKLTGGDRIHVHAKYKDPIEFTPTHLLLLLTNHKPRAEAADIAVWDRVHLIPFTLRFIDNPQKSNERLRDQYLPEKLQEERAGILAWLVRGCLAWQRAGGLNPPERVQMATQQYRSEVDTVGMFVDEYCVVAPDARVGHRKLYKEYTKWCKDLRLYPSGSRDFGAQMETRFKKKRMMAGMTYFGVGLPVDGPAG